MNKTIVTILMIGVVLLATTMIGFTQRSATKEQLLITFTDTNQVVRYYTYNVVSEISKEIDNQTLSGYPSSIINTRTNMFYYTSRDKRGSTQLFQVDIPSKQRQQVTTEFTYVDCLRIDEERNKIYMRVSLPGKRNFHIAAYDIRTKKIEVFHPGENDLSIKNFDFNSKRNEIVALEFSQSEAYDKVDQANKQHVSPELPTYRLKKYDVSHHEETYIAATHGREVLDISINPEGDEALYSSASSLWEDSQFTLYRVSLTDGKTEPVLHDNQVYGKLKQPQYSLNRDGFFFLATKMNSEPLTDMSGYEAKAKAICFFDNKTKQIREVWAKEGGVINNFLVIR